MFLVDTNIWLERLLDQARSDEVGRFLDVTPSDRLFISDFSFHSIGIIMMRMNQADQFLNFVRDVFIDAGVGLVCLKPEATRRIIEVAERFSLDFDDAYQYGAAETHALITVTFDRDFDRTERGRKEPVDIVGHT
jgi:predicted nucleic acid-binding protein